MNLTEALFDVLAGDPTIAGLVSEYAAGESAVFTIDPAPGDAAFPYIVAAGHVADVPWDTKTDIGREVWRDVRCYAEADGSADVVEALAERVRAVLHRGSFNVSGYGVVVAECSGPVVADERDAYGRVVTIRLKLMEV